MFEYAFPLPTYQVRKIWSELWIHLTCEDRRDVRQLIDCMNDELSPFIGDTDLADKIQTVRWLRITEEISYQIVKIEASWS